jgi:hypothetical protein
MPPTIVHLEDSGLFTDINKHTAFTMRDVPMYGYKLRTNGIKIGGSCRLNISQKT